MSQELAPVLARDFQSLLNCHPVIQLGFYPFIPGVCSVLPPNTFFAMLAQPAIHLTNLLSSLAAVLQGPLERVRLHHCGGEHRGRHAHRQRRLPQAVPRRPTHQAAQALSQHQDAALHIRAVHQGERHRAQDPLPPRPSCSVCVLLSSMSTYQRWKSDGKYHKFALFVSRILNLAITVLVANQDLGLADSS